MKKLTSSLLCLFIGTNAMALGLNLDEPKTIKSEKIEYNAKSDKITTSGETEIVNQSGQTIKLNGGTIDKKEDSMSARDIELWLGKNVYVRAEEVTQKINETIAKHAVFTACDKCDTFGNAWEISGNEVIHDKSEKMVYFHNAIFWIYNDNLPIFWLPYYAMPDPTVKYKSGLLMPSLESTSGMGTQINIPVYINISDRHDLTPVFSFLTKEKPLYQLEHRLNLDHAEFRTHGAYTHNKEGVNRWYIKNNDKIELGENARALVYIHRSSDDTFLQKYGFYNNQPYLDSGAKLELFGQTSYIVADAHIFQELRERSTPGDILPNVRGVYQTNPLFEETYLKFTGDILSVYGDQTSSQRLIGESRIISPWTLWGGNRLTLSAAARYDVYNFEDTAIYNPNNPNVPGQSYSGTKTRFLPNGYIEWDLPFFSVKNDWTYIIEPRARLTLMEHTDKSVLAYTNDSAGRFLSDLTLFSNNRYAGYDVWANGNFVDYGVQWFGFNKRHNIEVFAGQTYDFKRHNQDKTDFYENGFRNGFSDYVGSVSYYNKDIQLSSRFRLDKQDASLRHMENSVYLRYNRSYLSLGHIWDSSPIDIYSQKDADTNEIRGGIGLQLTDRLSVREDVTYNIYEHVIQQHSGGIYYDHPCYYLSLEYKRDNAIRKDYVGETTFKFKFGISIDGKHY
jgi:LPS-assembly protein